VGHIGASVFARTARTSVEKPAAPQRARPSRPSNVYYLAFQSSPRTLVFYASIFSQRASAAMAHMANELTSASSWKAARLTYIVNDECIKCKYMDCVELALPR
jgi:hypothetical protein